MPCRLLCLLHILCLIIQVDENRRSESDRRDLLIKARVALDSLTHAPYLLIGQRFCSAPNVFLGVPMIPTRQPYTQASVNMIAHPVWIILILIQSP